MSFDAIRWAMEQPARPALTKFVLIAMADCVNAEGIETVCWPSYAYLCQRTGMNTKTVEQAVFTLKSQGYIVDTGRRAGTTGKVVVYRLNTTISGGIQPGPLTPSANGTRPHNTTESGGVVGLNDAGPIPPNPEVNPPKSGDQSPQITQETPPKTGVVSRKVTKKESGRESGIDAACAALPDVPRQVIEAWLPVRREKKAGPVNEIVAAALKREAVKAGITATAAVTYCCEAGWQNFNAGFYAKREGHPTFGPRDGRGSQTHNPADRNAEAARLLGIEAPGHQETIDA